MNHFFKRFKRVSLFQQTRLAASRGLHAKFQSTVQATLKAANNLYFWSAAATLLGCGALTLTEDASQVRFAKIVEKCMPAVVRIEGRIHSEMPSGAGSGFVINEDGLVVTNSHVIQAVTRARTIEVHFADGEVFNARIIAHDEKSDIGVLQIIQFAGEKRKFPSLNIEFPLKTKIGDPLLVLGAALGGSIVASAGILGGKSNIFVDDFSGQHKMTDKADCQMLEIDASVHPGNSGGPVLNEHGEVIGVTCLMLASGVGVSALKYAISINQAWPVVQSLLKHQRVIRGVVGMRLIPLTRVTSEREFQSRGLRPLPPGSKAALWVTTVVPGSPAWRAGFREGDVILEIDGKKMTRMGSYFEVLGPVLEPGKELNCLVHRPATHGKGEMHRFKLKPAPDQMRQK